MCGRGGLSAVERRQLGSEGLRLTVFLWPWEEGQHSVERGIEGGMTIDKSPSDDNKCHSGKMTTMRNRSPQINSVVWQVVKWTPYPGKATWLWIRASGAVAHTHRRRGARIGRSARSSRRGCSASETASDDAQWLEGARHREGWHEVAAGWRNGVEKNGLVFLGG